MKARSPSDSIRFTRHSWQRPCRLLSPCRSLATPTEAVRNGEEQAGTAPTTPAARKISADRAFFLEVLSANASKRDARSYLANYNPAVKQNDLHDFSKLERGNARKDANRVNLGSLFPSDTSYEARRGDVSPSNPAHLHDGAVAEPLRTAIVLWKLDEYNTTDIVFEGIGRTLSQLRRLGLSPIVVLQPSNSTERNELRNRSYEVHTQSDRIVLSIEKNEGQRARAIQNAFTIDESSEGQEKVCTGVHDKIHLRTPSVLLHPLKRGVIPVVSPLAFDTDASKLEEVAASEVVLALVRAFKGLWPAKSPGTRSDAPVESPQALSLDRLIIIEPHGGLPWSGANSGSHVFVNLEQEYEDLRAEMISSNTLEESKGSHTNNLELAKDVLALLPPTSSVVIMSPQAAAIGPSRRPLSSGGKIRNPLIHNLLTDKPLFSASLPRSRLTDASSTSAQPSPPTLLKRGLPVTIYPSPRMTPWNPVSTNNPPFSLSSQDLNIPRLVELIEDSFGRTLDASAYFARVAPILAGIIVAGDYDGCAILTWEPPDVDADPRAAPDPQRAVPYLDKLAVRRASQGAGSVADLLFNAMVRDCFPHGVVWRSRTVNPVNGWYFERARGSWRLPKAIGGHRWTMFWTTPNVQGQKFQDYAAVCMGIGSFWKDGKGAE